MKGIWRAWRENGVKRTEQTEQAGEVWIDRETHVWHAGRKVLVRSHLPNLHRRWEPAEIAHRKHGLDVGYKLLVEDERRAIPR